MKQNDKLIRFLLTLLALSVILNLCLVAVSFADDLEAWTVSDEKEITTIKTYIYALKPAMKHKPDLTDRIARAVSKYHDDVDVKLVLAIMMRESSFNPSAIGGSDCGLMQVNVWYHAKRYKVSIEDLLNVETNIRIGCDILKNIIEQRKPQGFKYPWAFYNTNRLKIYDDKGNLVAGRIVYIRHVLKWYNKINRKVNK